MFDNLRGDVARVRDISLQRGWFQRFALTRTLRAFFHVGFPPIVAYRFGHWVEKKVRIPVVRQVLWIVANIFRRLTAIMTGVYIIQRAEIGPGLIIHTWYGVFIGAAKIGRNLTVGTGVLVSNGVISIGDDVWLGPGCKIMAGVKIGNNVVVMPNSLVLTDVPDDTTIVGVPARIKLRGGRPQRQASPPVQGSQGAKRDGKA
ncbi:MAG: serine O-acetyltransferase [Terriglobia bacterium]